MSNDKRWIPLESNPELFNTWATKAGLVASQAHFQDVYGLDEELLAMVSQPVKAVILLFPDIEEIAEWRKAEDIELAKGQPKLDKTIFWIKQTIRNACGTMALIHAIANADLTIAPWSPLAKFIDACKDKTPQERAHILETTTLFENIHAELASSGQTPVPTNLDTDLHFTCFVEAPEAEFRERAGAAVPLEDVNSVPSTGMRLVELNGDRTGPIDRGECKDLLKDVAAFVKEHYLSHSSSLNFSLIALGTPKTN